MPRLAVEQQDAERCFAPGFNGCVELRQERRLELAFPGEGRLPHHRAAQRLAWTRGPVKPAPREGTSQASRRPWADIQEPIERAGDPLAGDGAIELDHEERVVVQPGALPARVPCHQDEIGTTQGKAAHAASEAPHVRDGRQTRGPHHLALTA
jgi:hypothetical protein